MRPASGNLVNGVNAVFAVHRDDLFGRASICDQHPGKCTLTPSGTIFGYQFSITVLTLGTMTPSRTFPAMALLLVGAVFRPLDLIDNTAVAVAAIGEIAGLGRMLSDHRALSAVGLITPHAGLVPVQQLGQHRAVGDIGGRRHHGVDQLCAAATPKCAFMPKYHWLPFLVWCISGSRALSAFLVEDGALMIVASTIVPVATFSPFAAKCRCTSSNSC